MSFKDKHALETLPVRIADLEREIARLHALLGDGDLYARQPAKFADATKALNVAQESLGKAEEHWLALELLREELERA